MHSREYYHDLRNEYLPSELKLVFIAESPPISGAYFYDYSGKITEQLFRAMMQDVLGIEPSRKAEGLRKFAGSGFLLVDATYTPVNKGIPNNARNDRIEEDYQLLVSDFDDLLPSKETGLILVKANVCRILEDRLLSDGFNVLNKGRIVPFPGSGQQANFRMVIRELLP